MPSTAPFSIDSSPAIKAFADPSVNFGLQLKFDGEVDVPSSITLENDDAAEEAAEALAEETLEAVDADDDNVVTLDAFRKK